jgi:hypothetical protein
VTVSEARPASVTVALSRVAASPPATTGSLYVESRPTGATVFVDGKLTGTTPMLVDGLETGDRALRLESEGYRRWSSSVRIVAGERNKVAASLER